MRKRTKSDRGSVDNGSRDENNKDSREDRHDFALHFDPVSLASESEIELNLVETLYDSLFADKGEFYWTCNSSKDQLLLCVRETNLGWSGLAVSAQTTTPFQIKKVGLTEELMKQAIHELDPTDLVRIPSTPALIERVKTLFCPSKMGATAGLVYCKEGQDHRSSIMANVLEDCPKYFLTFVETLAEKVPDMRGFTKFNGGQHEGVGFHRHFRNQIEVLYHVAPFLSSDAQRQFIGNDRVLVVYFDASSQAYFDYDCLESFGAVPQSYIIVRPTEKSSVRVEFVSRVTLNIHLPHTPSAVLSLSEASNFIHLKVFNSIAESNLCPPFDRLFLLPRRHQLTHIIDEFSPPRRSPDALTTKKSKGIFQTVVARRARSTSPPSPKNYDSLSRYPAPDGTSSRSLSTSPSVEKPGSSGTKPSFDDIEPDPYVFGELEIFSPPKARRKAEKLDLDYLEPFLLDLADVPLTINFHSGPLPSIPSEESSRASSPDLKLSKSSPNLKKTRSGKLDEEPGWPDSLIKTSSERKRRTEENRRSKAQSDHHKPSPSPESRKRHSRSTKDIKLPWITPPQISSWRKCLDFHYSKLKDSHLHRFSRFFNTFLSGLGVPISSVYSVYNANLSKQFNVEREKMRMRISESERHSKQTFLHDPAKVWVYEEYKKRVDLFDWNQGELFPVVPVLYGADWSVAVRFCSSGFCSLTSGSFGQGLYFSSNAKYLAPYYGSSKDPALVLCFVIPGNVYPVTSEMAGELLQSGYQSHYAITSSSGAISTTNTESCDELVLANESQVLPAYLISLDPNRIGAVQQWMRPLKHPPIHFGSDSVESQGPEIIDSEEEVDRRTNDDIFGFDQSSTPPRGSFGSIIDSTQRKDLELPSSEGLDGYEVSRHYHLIPVRLWTIDHTCSWLDSLDLDLDIPTWKRQRVDGRCILELSDFTLKNDLGLSFGKTGKWKGKRNQLLAQQDSTFEFVQITEWTVDHVCAWIESLGLKAEAWAVTGKELLFKQEPLLINTFQSLGDRLKFQRELKLLKRSADNSSKIGLSHSSSSIAL